MNGDGDGGLRIEFIDNTPEHAELITRIVRRVVAELEHAGESPPVMMELAASFLLFYAYAAEWRERGCPPDEEDQRQPSKAGVRAALGELAGLLRTSRLL